MSASDVAARRPVADPGGDLGFDRPAPDPAAPIHGEIYRAFWRWHFYAGLLVMPVLMLMAATGALYLFKDELDHALYGSMVTVPARAAAASPAAWAGAAMTAVPHGRLVQLETPGTPRRSARLVVETSSGRSDVFVDPFDARVLGVRPNGGVMQTVKDLHSLAAAGPGFNLLVEMVAGWTLVMVATGAVLWWPRRRRSVLAVRGGPGRRSFWQDLHVAVGVFAAGVIAFLALTGMPWSGLWGETFRDLVNQAGWGRPDPPRRVAASAHGGGHGPSSSGRPWTLEDLELQAAHGPVALTLDQAVERLDAAGLPRPYVISIPADPGRAWSVVASPPRVEDMRTVYLDGATGETIADIGFGQLGPVGQAVEWGVSAHQGRQFGLPNKLLMLAGCLAVWMLGASGLLMWWKRRPRGRLAAPAPTRAPGAQMALAAVVGPLALVFPLVGASLATVLGFDVLLRRLARRAARTAFTEGG